MRDFVEPGKGENGIPHHTNPDQKDQVDKTIEEYGKLKITVFGKGFSRYTNSSMTVLFYHLPLQTWNC